MKPEELKENIKLTQYEENSEPAELPVAAPASLPEEGGRLLLDGQGNPLPIDDLIANLPEHFEILSILGEGGNGCVFKARDKKLNKLFAIKMLRPHLIEDKQALARFQEEAKVAKGMTHVNLAGVYDYGVGNAGAPYLVMDYLEGKSLDKIIRDEHGLSVPRAIDLFIQITEAVGHAHKKGLVHRDIKPSNIIVETKSDGVEIVKLVDFGIAKSLLGSNSMARTRTGDVIGSPPYMAPEQCEGTKLDTRADIYSLGCVMFETIAGEPPFPGKNAIQIILHHIKDPPPTLSERKPNRGVTNDLDYIVQKCMQKDRWARYQGMDELRADLESLRDQKTIKQFIPRTPPKEKKKLSFPLSARWLTAGILAVAALAGCFLAAQPPYSPTENTHQNEASAVIDRVPEQTGLSAYEVGKIKIDPLKDAERMNALGDSLSLNSPESAIHAYEFAHLTYLSDVKNRWGQCAMVETTIGKLYDRLGKSAEAKRYYHLSYKHNKLLHFGRSD